MSDQSETLRAALEAAEHLRYFARHGERCAFRAEHPDTKPQPRCDCGFDAVVETFDYRVDALRPDQDTDRCPEREALQETLFALSFHDQTPTGRRRRCLDGCVACNAITAGRADLGLVA